MLRSRGPFGPGFGRYSGETEIKKPVLGHPHVLTLGRSPLKLELSPWHGQSWKTLSSSCSLGKYFQFQMSGESFYISLQVKELQGYLELRIPLGFNLLIAPFCKLPNFHGVGLSQL